MKVPPSSGLFAHCAGARLLLICGTVDEANFLHRCLAVSLAASSIAFRARRIAYAGTSTRGTDEVGKTVSYDRPSPFSYPPYPSPPPPSPSLLLPRVMRQSDFARDAADRQRAQGSSGVAKPASLSGELFSCQSWAKAAALLQVGF